MPLNDLAAIVLAATVGTVVARQVAQRGPPVWVVFLCGAFAMVATGVVSPPAASLAVATNLPILVFLFSLFVFAAGLEQAGALDHLATWVIGRTRRPRDLPFLLFVAFATLSAFLLNDALVLVGVPLLFSLARRMRVSAEPLLLTLAYSVTVGSVVTPFGNPQNLLVSLESGLQAPVATFLRYLLLPSIVNIVAGGLLLRSAFGRQLSNAPTTGAAPVTARTPLFPSRNLGSLVRKAPVLVMFPVTIATLISADLTADVTRGPMVPLYAIALAGALATLVASAGRSALLARVKWSILALFAGLFVVVAGAVAGGVLGSIESLLPVPGPGRPVPATLAILVTSLAGSQIVSNVPWVGLQIPLLHGLGFGPGTPWAWMALAAGSTLAGNLTLLGAASNLIVVEQAERAGLRISLRSFVRLGLPLTVLTVGVLSAFLIAGL